MHILVRVHGIPTSRAVHSCWGEVIQSGVRTDGQTGSHTQTSVLSAVWDSSL